MSVNNKLGAIGESLAASYLERLGYQILERNWRFRHLEIDIIAVDADTIVFVEVKSRSSNYWGNPEDSVSDIKIKRIVEAANHYIQLQDSEYLARFDIISIVKNKDQYTLDHIEDAFFAPLN